MSDATSTAPVPGRTRPAARRGLRPAAKRGILIAAAVVLLVAMVASTKFVPKGSTLGQGPAAFDPAAYGAKQFPVQQQYVSQKAVDAETLAAAVKKDQTAAGQKYGVSGDSGATVEVPVKFTGVVGTVPAAGYTPIRVSGLTGTKIAVQLGPAINGTDLRDATGKIQLGQFENQIQYQDAGTAINNELKKVLAKADGGDPKSLEGKTVTVSGVFSLINPALWNVTPATIEVQ